MNEIQKKCDKCGNRMVIRTKKSGDDQGSKYWVCLNYNVCKNFYPYEVESNTDFEFVLVDEEDNDPPEDTNKNLNKAKEKLFLIDDYNRILYENLIDGEEILNIYDYKLHMNDKPNILSSCLAMTNYRIMIIYSVGKKHECHCLYYHAIHNIGTILDNTCTMYVKGTVDKIGIEKNISIEFKTLITKDKKDKLLKIYEDLKCILDGMKGDDFYNKYKFLFSTDVNIDEIDINYAKKRVDSNFKESLHYKGSDEQIGKNRARRILLAEYPDIEIIDEAQCASGHLLLGKNCLYSCITGFKSGVLFGLGHTQKAYPLESIEAVNIRSTLIAVEMKISVVGGKLTGRNSPGIFRDNNEDIYQFAITEATNVKSLSDKILSLKNSLQAKEMTAIPGRPINY